MKKGKLIVIEGNDGSGKGTQLKLLLSYLKKTKIPYASFDFPQYEKTFFGNFAGRFLNGEFGHFSRINPYLAMFPYAGDRWQVKDSIYKELNKGKIVLCNRYTPSVVYQMVKVKPSQRQTFLDWSERLEYEIFGIPKEDLVVFLYVPFNIAHKLIDLKKQRVYMKDKNKDQYEENALYLQKVEKMYLWMIKHKKHWIKIDCVEDGRLLSKEEVHKKVVKVVKKDLFTR